MHEMGIVSGILDVVIATARANAATSVKSATVRIGEMCAVVPESLDFAWEVLREEDPLTEAAELHVEEVAPESECTACGERFSHDRFHLRCPACGSAETHLLHGRELDVASVEIETPDE